MTTSSAATAIIPARLASTRLPRKAMLGETGRPLVVHACERAASAASVSRVVVATDADEIAAAVRTHGFEAVMTSTDHPNGTSRLGEAAHALGLAPDAIVVNVQGDEPEIEPAVIDGAVDAVRTGIASVAGPCVGTVVSPLHDASRAHDPNVVKAVCAGAPSEGVTTRALYFSRAVVPHTRDGAAGPWLRHVGIYAYAVRALDSYASMAPGHAERMEQLEQLRWLAHGVPIFVAVRTSTHTGIDTPEQYAAFVARWRGRA